MNSGKELTTLGNLPALPHALPCPAMPCHASLQSRVPRNFLLEPFCHGVLYQEDPVLSAREEFQDPEQAETTKRFKHSCKLCVKQ